MIYEATVMVLRALFRIVTVKEEILYLERISPMPPHTIDEAMDSLLGKMDLKAKTRLARMAVDDLLYLHTDFGEYIRDGFDLVLGNVPLMTSCRITVGIEDLDEEGASFLIFTKLWEKLKETHSLKVV